MKLIGLFVLAGSAGAVLGARYLAGPAGSILPEGGTHGAWYASRAAGLASYLCLWLSLVGGLMMSSAWFDGIIGRAKLLAIHQTSAITGVCLGLAHGLVLIPDQWTHFGFRDILVPFASYYKTSLAGLGTVSLYMFAIVTFSFWLRNQIGTQMWKRIHYASFIAYLAALYHGVEIGTDSKTPIVMGLYLVTSMTIVTGFVVRMTYTRPVRRKATAPAATA